MTEKEFTQQAAMIQEEKFVSASDDPIEYGLGRAQFREKQFLRLLSLAKQVPTRLGQRTVVDLERKMAKSRSAQERFRSMMEPLPGDNPAGEEHLSTVELDGRVAVHPGGSLPPVVTALDAESETTFQPRGIDNGLQVESVRPL